MIPLPKRSHISMQLFYYKFISKICTGYYKYTYWINSIDILTTHRSRLADLCTQLIVKLTASLIKIHKKPPNLAQCPLFPRSHFHTFSPVWTTWPDTSVPIIWNYHSQICFPHFAYLLLQIYARYLNLDTSSWRKSWHKTLGETLLLFSHHIQPHSAQSLYL